RLAEARAARSGDGRIGSVRGKTSQLDGSGPQLAVGGDHGGKLRRRVADRFDAESLQLLDEGAIFGYPPRLRGNAIDNRLRRAGGSHQTPPRGGLKSGKARFRNRRYVGRLRR